MGREVRGGRLSLLEPLPGMHSTRPGSPLAPTPPDLQLGIQSLTALFQASAWQLWVAAGCSMGLHESVTYDSMRYAQANSVQNSAK